MTNSSGNNNATQAKKILELLRSKRGQWVPLPEILPLAAQYNARIWSLRKDGFEIDNKVVTNAAGERHSSFMLVREPEPLTIAQRPAIQLGLECQMYAPD